MKQGFTSRFWCDRMTQERVTVTGLIKEFFQMHPYKEMRHGPVVEYVSERYMEANDGHRPQDPWRAIRSLYQEGFLQKVRKGIYCYDPDAVTERVLEDFTPAQKEIILERDGHKCVVCGRGERDGLDLHVDHIKPRNRGGKATLENGQTLCTQHNNLKKQLDQTEAGKRMFIRLHELARAEDNEELQRFCEDILETYEKHGINGHIEWNR